MFETTRNYELVFIANAQLDDEAVATLIQRVSGWITAANGTVSEPNVWGRRNLAYAIKKQSEGIYVQLNFQVLHSASRELDRNLRLEESILRHMVIRLDAD